MSGHLLGGNATKRRRAARQPPALNVLLATLCGYYLALWNHPLEVSRLLGKCDSWAMSQNLVRTAGTHYYACLRNVNPAR